MMTKIRFSRTDQDIVTRVSSYILFNFSFQIGSLLSQDQGVRFLPFVAVVVKHGQGKEGAAYLVLGGAGCCRIICSPFETDVFYRLPVLDFSPFDWREAGNMNLHKNVTSSGRRQGWRMELMFLLIHIITLVCNYCSQCREEGYI